MKYVWLASKPSKQTNKQTSKQTNNNFSTNSWKLVRYCKLYLTEPYNTVRIGEYLFGAFPIQKGQK